jgi:hypothetical protein
MANHKEWIELSIIEKIDMVGKLTHLLQNDEMSFHTFKNHIEKAESYGIFDEIKINKNELHDNAGN